MHPRTVFHPPYCTTIGRIRRKSGSIFYTPPGISSRHITRHTRGISANRLFHPGSKLLVHAIWLVLGLYPGSRVRDAGIRWGLQVARMVSHMSNVFTSCYIRRPRDRLQVPVLYSEYPVWIAARRCEFIWSISRLSFDELRYSCFPNLNQPARAGNLKTPLPLTTNTAGRYFGHLEHPSYPAQPINGNPKHQRITPSPPLDVRDVDTNSAAALAGCVAHRCRIVSRWQHRPMQPHRPSSAA